MKYSIFIIVQLLVQNIYPQNVIYKDFKQQFDKHGVEGCISIYDQSSQEIISYNPEMCDQLFVPASTFKIVNSLIALEEDIIIDTSQVFVWNGYEWSNTNCNQNQTLNSALKNSCVWVFHDISQQIGNELYSRYLCSFGYGNINVKTQNSLFWLKGPLKISANQQVEFLRKFYNYNLDVSRINIDVVKDIIIIEREEDYNLSGKTGGAIISKGKYILWFVGYLEINNETIFFAMNFITDDYNKTKNSRYLITKSILKELYMN